MEPPFTRLCPRPAAGGHPAMSRVPTIPGTWWQRRPSPGRTPTCLLLRDADRDQHRRRAAGPSPWSWADCRLRSTVPVGEDVRAGDVGSFAFIVNFTDKSGWFAPMGSTWQVSPNALPMFRAAEHVLATAAHRPRLV